MTNNSIVGSLSYNEGANKKTARLAGLFFLLMIVFGLFAQVFFRDKLFVPNNIEETTNNILSNIFLYRVGIVSDILMSSCYLMTALVLYKLLYSINKNIASAMVLFALAGSIILLFNILNEFAPLYILSENEYLNSMNFSQRQSLAMLFYNLYEYGYVIGQIFFSLWVLPLGILIYKSGFIPKIFSIMFVVETVFGLTEVIIHFLLPNESVEVILLLPGAIAEITFMLWLLIRGINQAKAPK